MSDFARRCGLHGAAREQALARFAQQLEAWRLDSVRFVWCDLHGVTRTKSLTAAAALQAMSRGVGMVSTLLLKDSSDRTVYPVFEPGGTNDLPGFSFANNLMLMADPDSLVRLPWAEGVGRVQGQLYFQDGQPVLLDTRRVLQQALARLGQAGLGLTCGLEVEFHIYRLEDSTAARDPDLAAWPGPPPSVSLIHPGYSLLSEAWADLAAEPLRIVQQTAQALGLPLSSLEIELGPSQVEAVFEAGDAMTAADNMVLFRQGVRQALQRAGYHATFMCRPPFPNIMSSGWHLHQSLVSLADGTNVFMRDAPAAGTTMADARFTLSDTGAAYLAGLMAHARGMTVLCTPTANGYGRFRPNALAPQSVLWGRDNRGAMLRVIGEAGETGTRIENRVGEPAANPYLYIAAQIHAGLDGVERGLLPPPATDAPYAGSAADRLPVSLDEALDALKADACLTDALGPGFVAYYERAKRSEAQRRLAAEDQRDFDLREYFGRI